jgi:hypothetical protein
LPMAGAKDIPTIPGERLAEFQPSFDPDPTDAVFKALGVHFFTQESIVVHDREIMPRRIGGHPSEDCGGRRPSPGAPATVGWGAIQTDDSEDRRKSAGSRSVHTENLASTSSGDARRSRSRWKATRSTIGRPASNAQRPVRPARTEPSSRSGTWMRGCRPPRTRRRRILGVNPPNSARARRLRSREAAWRVGPPGRRRRSTRTYTRRSAESL